MVEMLACPVRARDRGDLRAGALASGLAVVRREKVAALLPDPAVLDGRDATSVALAATGRTLVSGLGAVPG